MRDFIADKELSDTQALQENDSITESVGAANDDEHQEEKKTHLQKRGNLATGWPGSRTLLT